MILSHYYTFKKVVLIKGAIAYKINFFVLKDEINVEYRTLINDLRFTLNEVLLLKSSFDIRFNKKAFW